MENRKLKNKGNTSVDVPKEFTKDVIDTIKRIEHGGNAIGVLYLKNDVSAMYTIPQAQEMVLSQRLPSLSKAVSRAILELDILDELIAYRIITRKNEISVAVDTDFAAVVVHARSKVLLRSSRRHRDPKTAAINSSNPMVDRIMDDESVEGVIMTNKEGAPVLTNVSVTHATLYGRTLHKYGVMAMIYMKELDPFDDILAIRLHTKKKELILAPHREFHIIIVQHFRKAIKGTNVT